jgi:hypothetical protein
MSILSGGILSDFGDFDLGRWKVREKTLHNNDGVVFALLSMISEDKP